MASPPEPLPPTVRALGWTSFLTDLSSEAIYPLLPGFVKGLGGTSLDVGLVDGIEYVQANAECLPFADASFDCVTIGFGLRNVTDKQKALASMRRVLKPGGQLLVLEFSKPVDALRPVYDAYSFRVLPLIGKFVAGDEASYRYLAESIRKHPDQETLLGMMRDAGLEDCRHHDLSGGIVALHRGYRY